MYRITSELCLDLTFCDYFSHFYLTQPLVIISENTKAVILDTYLEAITYHIIQLRIHSLITLFSAPPPLLTSQFNFIILQIQLNYCYPASNKELAFHLKCITYHNKREFQIDASLITFFPY